MVAISITNKSGEKFTFATGEVSNIDATIQGEIDQTKLPGTGPSQAFVFDFAGASKQIVLRGVLFDDGTEHLSGGSGSAITILEQKQFLEKILDGAQFPAAGRFFTSDFESVSFNGTTGTPTVAVINSIKFMQEQGNPEALPFEITLFVGQ